MTNQLCLQQQCSRLYKKMLQQLACYETSITDEKKWIEWGFGLTTKAWFSIQKKIEEGYQFANQPEEIIFYKILQPRFIGFIDFFTLLYKSLLFQPDDKAGKKEYWKSELATCKKFYSKHQAFCRYYEQGHTAMDHIYFVQETNQHPIIFGLNENKAPVAGSHSYLLARIISIKKYERYIREKTWQYSKVLIGTN